MMSEIGIKGECFISDFENFIMRLLLILACFVGPTVFFACEAAVIKVVMYEMLEIDHDIWNDLLPFFFLRQV